MGDDKDKCVGLQCELDAKDIFDKNLRKPVLKQLKDTIKPLVDKTKGLAFDENCKDGWLLTATVVSLQQDAKDPEKIVLKITIGGVPLKGNTKGFVADGSTKADGIRANKLEKDVTSVVDSAVTKVMKEQVLPQLLKGG